MNRYASWLLAAGLGAAAMYFLGPARRQRRPASTPEAAPSIAHESRASELDLDDAELGANPMPDDERPWAPM